jgi:hypothetical protein
LQLLAPEALRLRTRLGAFAVSFAVGLIAASGACGSGVSGGSEAPGAGPSTAVCTPCVTTSDCPGAVCAQVGGDTYCAVNCGEGGACAEEARCAPIVSVEGIQTAVCLPTGTSPCAAPAPVAPPSPDAAKGGAKLDAGAAVTGAVGPNGGTLSRLLFAVVGDTRPPVINDTKAYPTGVATAIYKQIEAATPRPAFAVSTGDYLFSSANGSAGAPQLDLYVAARSHYSGVLFPAMGNHECTGATSSNCGPGTADGVTANYQAFVSKLLAPIGKTSPNYSVEIAAPDASWTSKLVFVAGNAWSAADSAWLEATLSKPTTYTFIVRHEPKEASQAPGCRDSEPIMARHPYTLAIVGHTHLYARTGPRQVTIGNGGAPLVGGGDYGFALVQQRADGAIQVDMIDYATGLADESFRFALRPDGSAAP